MRVFLVLSHHEDSKARLRWQSCASIHRLIIKRSSEVSDRSFPLLVLSLSIERYGPSDSEGVERKSDRPGASTRIEYDVARESPLRGLEPVQDRYECRV